MESSVRNPGKLLSEPSWNPLSRASPRTWRRWGWCPIRRKGKWGLAWEGPVKPLTAVESDVLSHVRPRVLCSSPNSMPSFICSLQSLGDGFQCSDILKKLIANKDSLVMFLFDGKLFPFKLIVTIQYVQLLSDGHVLTALGRCLRCWYVRKSPREQTHASPSKRLTVLFSLKNG